MTREELFVGQLESYLDDFEGITPLPDAVRHAVRAELPKTRQIGSRWDPTRFFNMTLNIHPARYGLVAAVVMAAAVIGIVFFQGSSSGGPDATPTPKPPGMPAPGSELDAGTYTLVGNNLHATITVPAGWTNVETRGVVTGDVEGETFMGVVFWPFPVDLDTVYTDPCHWAGNEIDPPVGPTVDDLATALAAQSMRGDPVPTDVIVDGYRGKVLDMTVPDDIVIEDCDLNEFRSWVGRFHQGPGQRDRVYILDVKGERLVLVVHHMPGVADADLAELQRVFESIDLEP